MARFRKAITMNNEIIPANRERTIAVLNGWIMLVVVISLLLGSTGLIIYSIVGGIQAQNHPYFSLLIVSVLLEIVTFVCLPGFFTLQPNEARVLILFGAYRGTVRQSGFHWGNPFYSNGGQPSGATRRMSEAEGNLAKGKLAGGVRHRRSQSRHRISLRARTLN